MHEVWDKQQTHEDARKIQKIGIWRKRHLGAHDLVRRMDRQGEVLIWCRKSSGYARQRMGPKFKNCCKWEHVGTKEYGKMFKRFHVLENGRVPAKDARDWKIEGQKIEESIRGFLTSLKWKVSWLGISPEKMCCRIEESGQRKKVTLLESFRPRMKKIP